MYGVYISQRYRVLYGRQRYRVYTAGSATNAKLRRREHIAFDGYVTNILNSV
jgi:hypothetical protein